MYSFATPKEVGKVGMKSLLFRVYSHMPDIALGVLLSTCRTATVEILSDVVVTKTAYLFSHNVQMLSMLLRCNLEQISDRPDTHMDRA